MDEKNATKEKEKSIDRSIDERVHQQLVYKDNRIIDLNNVILDKERQILDLQERVREHNEVATVKNQAMRIVQQQFQEMNRDKKDMSTETEPNLLSSNAPSTSNYGTKNTERRARSSSPGHVIAARKSVTSTSSGTFSPPPSDPPFDSSSSSHFSNKLSALPDIDGIHRKQHSSHRSSKRVTFDLNPNSALMTSSAIPTSSSSLRHPHSDAFESALTEATTENALLRQQIIDLNSSVDTMKLNYETEIVKYTKEAKTAGLKAKVVATARIKELESTLEEINGKYQDETERLQEEVETLRNSRNWEIEQNAHLRDQVAHLKEKSHKLTEELDASEKSRRTLDSETEESKKLMELMVEDLLQAEAAINYHVNQKTAIFEDIDRLKEAIMAQDRFIEILEADIVIYEQHIGLLRENLGASQIDHRALIKSKAFETKLLALEREKEQSDKKSNEDRLKTKALDKKCRVLVEQNEQLMARLCELEMSNGGTEDEQKDRHIDEQDERIRQISSALESERDVSQRLREAKESLERELMTKRKQEEATNSRFQIDVEMSRMEAQNKVEEMGVEVEAARKKVTEVMAELEQLRATNFDLQMHIETAKRTMEELADSNEQLEKRIEEVEEDCEEKEEDLKQSTWDVETLTRQNEALRVELDGVRQGFHETRELADEVKQLKTELQRQQEVHRAQFEAACEQLEHDEDAPERKTSLEVQQEQYILAYEEKIEKMNREMEMLKKELELQNGPVQRKTTAVLEAPRIEQIQKHTVQMTSSAPPPEVSRAQEQLKQEIEELKRRNADFEGKMERLEMEAKLSGELNVELGRAMLELEEHNELLRKEQEAVTADDVATGRELELHVMMVQEMTEQIASMQSKIDEMEQQKQAQLMEVEKLKVEASTAHQETQRVNSELKRVLHNLAESEIARKDEFEKSNSSHDAEIRAFSIRMEDSRREIADLEVKLQEAERKLLISQVQEAPILQETHILTSTSSESREMTSEAPEDESELREQQQHNLLHDVSRDMSKLIELKDELEIAVQALKAEIWSLNGQLKASILDREGLEDKVAELDDLVEKEKKRAIALDVELQEQIDLTDRAVRRAAEAENESNQRMAECLEKETRREEIEKAYTRLNEYYNQLQEAYNNVYAQLAAASQSATVSEVPTTSTSILTLSMSPEDPESSRIINSLMTILLISRDPLISLTTQQKLEQVAEKMKQILDEFGENQKALEEQRRITEALEQRLQSLEATSSDGNSDEVTTTRERIQQLEGEIEWKEDECESLKRRIRDLEKALEAVAERADESEAARLTTRQADVDSLFRTNAELAHTNVRLQNEVDEMEELKTKIIEEKQQLEQHVKELEEQVAELMEQHETHLQQCQLLQSSVPIPPQDDSQLEESQKEIQRLAAIEKTLNNRILALEDQNLELEEKVQEIEDEMMTVKRENAQNVAQNKGESSENWDSWGENDEEGAKSEVERLLEIEKTLTMRMEALQMHNEQLEQKVKEQEMAKKTAQPPPQKQQCAPKREETPKQEEDDDWKWGDDDVETPSSIKEAYSPAYSTCEPVTNPNTPDYTNYTSPRYSPPSHEPTYSYTSFEASNPEAFAVNSEVVRLTQVEKTLNNRIMALEEQNMELEERLQELEDELLEEKQKNQKTLVEQQNESKEPVKEENNWDDWGDDDEDVVVPKQEQDSEDLLQKTITELQERVKFQKEVIEKAEANLIETQDKYDELEEAYEQAKQSSSDQNEQLVEQLQLLKSQLEHAQHEKQATKLNLEKIETEKLELEEKIKELEAKKTVESVENDGWNDDGWGENEEKVDEEKDNEELLQLRQTQQELTDRICHLEQENLNQHNEFAQKINSIESRKTQIETQLHEALDKLEDVKEILKLKEAELTVAQVAQASEAATSSGWNDDDDWNDNGEIEKLKETQKVLEMKVEMLQEELYSVKEREQELTETNSTLQSRLQTIQTELEETKLKLAETSAETASGWNDTDDWNSENQLEEVKQQLESEIFKRNETIENLQEQIAQLQKELIDSSETADLKALEELETVKNELKLALEQNGLLKDSEARLMDHADDFAEQMEKYKEKCTKLTSRIAELEAQIQKGEEKQMKMSSDELVTLRQKLANAQQEIRAQKSIISDREGLISELRRQIAEHTKTIEELQLKLKTLSRRATGGAPRASVSSTTTNTTAPRPSSRLSTSSRVSTTSSFVPDAVSVPLQSMGSAFDVVVPQSGEPLRRRNK